MELLSNAQPATYKGQNTKVLLSRPEKTLQLDCHDNADFAGLWNVKHDKDPTCVNSRTGCLILFMNFPLLWTSKLKIQIALGTMEANYIALLTAMRNLVDVCGLLKEVYSIVIKCSEIHTEYYKISKTFGTISQFIVHEDNSACLKFSTFSNISPQTKHIAIPYHFF